MMKKGTGASWNRTSLGTRRQSSAMACVPVVERSITASSGPRRPQAFSGDNCGLLPDHNRHVRSLCRGLYSHPWRPEYRGAREVPPRARHVDADISTYRGLKHCAGSRDQHGGGSFWLTPRLRRLRKRSVRMQEQTLKAPLTNL